MKFDMTMGYPGEGWRFHIMVRRSAYRFFLLAVKDNVRACAGREKVLGELDDARYGRRSALRRLRTARLKFDALSVIHRRMARRGARTGRRLRRQILIATAREHCWTELRQARRSYQTAKEHHKRVKLLSPWFLDAALDLVAQTERMLAFWRAIGLRHRTYSASGEASVRHVAYDGGSQCIAQPTAAATAGQAHAAWICDSSRALSTSKGAPVRRVASVPPAFAALAPVASNGAYANELQCFHVPATSSAVGPACAAQLCHMARSWSSTRSLDVSCACAAPAGVPAA